MRKKPEERKNEILDVADLLFAQKGYDNTSTNDILEMAGIARGALYHHFKSKEEIMDSLIERYSNRVLEAAKAVAADRSAPVKERVIQTIMALNIQRAGGAEIIRQAHRPQNALMHEKLQRAMINGLTPILTEIIREGIGQGIFHTAYPFEGMEMMVIYINTVFDRGIPALTDEEKAARLRALLSNMEQLLGTESGSLMDAAEVFGRQIAAKEQQGEV